MGEDVSRTMYFDLEEILREHTSAIDPIIARSSSDSHFTTVRLENLNQVPRGQNLGKIKSHLKGIYREYLRTNQLQLFFNGEKMEYEEPDLLSAPKAGGDESNEILWRKEIEFELGPGKHVRGFAGLRAVGSTTYAGFALLRKNRLIEGSSDETFRPQEIFGGSNSYTFQRLFGEFHLSGFNVTHTKDAIKWADGERDAFIKQLKAALVEEPMNLLQQAEKHRSRTLRPEPEILGNALDNLRNTLTAGLPEFVETVVPIPARFDAKPIPERISEPSSSSIETELTFDTLTHGYWKVRIVGINDEAKSNFFEVSSHTEIAGVDGQSQNEMEVFINLGHPFAIQYLGSNFENSELMFAFTSSLAIALALGRSVGARSNYIVDYLNDILRFRSQL
jgi:hypothetical protein